jgi:hypothetical protein
MKRFIAIILLAIVSLTGCRSEIKNEQPAITKQPITNNEQWQSDDLDTNNEQNVDELPSAGKIVLITNAIQNNEDEYLSAEALVAKFGQEQVIHKTWPGDVAGAEGIIADILQEISENPEVRAIVLTSPPYFRDSYVVDALHYLRDDVFLVYAPSIHVAIADDVAARFDMIIQTNMQRLGEDYVMQAISMGADTIAHYSFPWFRAMPAFAMRRDAMKTAANREGIRFIDLEAPTPWGDIMPDDIITYMVQDLPRQVDRLGKNTAFFGTFCDFQKQIISQTIATGAIFVNTCCQSPYHEYPEAMEIEYRIPSGENDEFERPIMRRLELSELLQAIDEAVDAADMAGRISSWAVPDSAMWTTIGFMYTMEWLNGNVPEERGVIDIETLGRLAREYTAQLGVDATVTLEIFARDGKTIGPYALGVIDYHVFG